MAIDREVLRDLWDGKLPVCFILNNEEVCDVQTPEAFYLMVPRLSYFPLVWDKVNYLFSLDYIANIFLIKLRLGSKTLHEARSYRSRYGNVVGL